MDFKKRVLGEAAVRYLFTFSVVALLYPSIRGGLENAAATGKLEAIHTLVEIRD